MFMDPSLAAKAGKASMGAKYLAAKKVAVSGHEQVAAKGMKVAQGNEQLAVKKAVVQASTHGG